MSRETIVFVLYEAVAKRALVGGEGRGGRHSQRRNFGTILTVIGGAGKPNGVPVQESTPTGTFHRLLLFYDLERDT